MHLLYIDRALGKNPAFVENVNYIVVAVAGAGLVTKHNSVKKTTEQKKKTESRTFYTGSDKFVGLFN